MKFDTYLKNKNLSINTITVYKKLLKQYLDYCQLTINKKTIISFINLYAKDHQPQSVRLLYATINAYLKFRKEYKLINDIKQIKLPKIQSNLKDVISINDFINIARNIKPKTWYEKRNWLIFSILFLTGMRVSELLQFELCKIYNQNKINIKGKGNKQRVIYLNDYLISLLKKWRCNKVTITKNKKMLSTKQINVIIKTLSQQHFNKTLTSHGLRRSYATNLIKKNINIEIVRQVLGHNNITTTAKYLMFTDDEIVNEIAKILN